MNTHLLYGKTVLSHACGHGGFPPQKPDTKPDGKMPKNLGYCGIELEIFIYKEFYSVNTIQDFCFSM